MNLLSHSNGIYKLKKEKINVFVLMKRIFLIVLSLILIGFVIQKTIDIIDGTKMKSKFKYVRIEGKKMEYEVSGSGQYTVVMDGDIGNTLFQWDKVCNELEREGNYQTFIYNRRGYGFNDGGSLRTPKEQAEDLKILLKKTGLVGPYILVGERYGSLVITNFASKYPELVAGVVLIDPISEEDITNGIIKKQIGFKYYRSKMESIGANFMLTTLMNKLGITLENEYFQNNLSKSKLEDFKKLENKKNYRQAVSNELKNLCGNYEMDSQKQNMLEGKPLYIISKDSNDKLLEIGDSKYTKLYQHTNDSEVFSISDSDIVVNGINSILKDIKKIEKKQ